MKNIAKPCKPTILYTKLDLAFGKNNYLLALPNSKMLI